MRRNLPPPSPATSSGPTRPHAPSPTRSRWGGSARHARTTDPTPRGRARAGVGPAWVRPGLSPRRAGRRGRRPARPGAWRPGPGSPPGRDGLAHQAAEPLLHLGPRGRRAGGEAQHLHGPATLGRHASHDAMPSHGRVPYRRAGARGPPPPRSHEGHGPPVGRIVDEAHVDAVGKRARVASPELDRGQARRRCSRRSAAAAITAPTSWGTLRPWTSISATRPGPRPTTRRWRDRSRPWTSVWSRWRSAMRGTPSPSRARRGSRRGSASRWSSSSPATHCAASTRNRTAPAPAPPSGGTSTERDPPRRHVAPGVADAQLGEQHRRTPLQRRSTMAAASSEVLTSVAPSMRRAKS